MKYHEPVMVSEVVSHFKISAHSKIIDATLGTGGHSKAIIEAGAKVLGIEMDPKMLAIAKKRLPKAKLVLGNFVDIEKIAKENNFEKVDGILFDLGVSNLHLKEDDRGFSFANPDQVLDMRLNPESQGVKASDLLNVLDKTQLTNLFLVTMKYGDAKKLAERIIENRSINTVSDLLHITYHLSPKRKLHEATLPMLALRIAVNSELENLKEVLPKAKALLKVGGKLLVITFHSGEVEIVKEFDRKALKVLPSENEVNTNPRARSAKLWIIQKK